MLVESHWRLLKRNFHVKRNRPRMDFVTHVMNTQMVLKSYRDYEHYLLEHKKRDCWRQPCKNWKDLSFIPLQFP